MNGYSVLVDTSGLSSMEEILVASVITRRVLETYGQLFLDDRERFAALPPDARRARGGAARALEGAAQPTRTCSRAWRARAASSRSGLCAVSQQPKLIDDELLSQFNTFFILGLADEKDRNILRGSSKQDISDLGPEIQTLMPGEAIITNLEAPFALPAQVYLYEEYLKSVRGAFAAAAAARRRVEGVRGVDGAAGRARRRASRPDPPRAPARRAGAEPARGGLPALVLVGGRHDDRARARRVPVARRHLRPRAPDVPDVRARARRVAEAHGRRAARRRDQREPRHAAGARHGLAVRRARASVPRRHVRLADGVARRRPGRREGPRRAADAHAWRTCGRSSRRRQADVGSDATNLLIAHVALTSLPTRDLPRHQRARGRGGGVRQGVRPRAARSLPRVPEGLEADVVRGLDRHVLVRGHAGRGEGSRRRRHRDGQGRARREPERAAARDGARAGRGHCRRASSSTRSSAPPQAHPSAPSSACT